MDGWASRATGVTERALATTKFSAWVLAIALGFNSGASAWQGLAPSESALAPTPEQRRAAKIKVEVIKRGVGAKSRVRVKLRDKHEVKGHITQIDEDKFQVQIEPDWLDEPSTKDQLITIPYAEVDKIRGPRSKAASIGIGVGTTVAAILLLGAILVLEAQKHKRGY